LKTKKTSPVTVNVITLGCSKNLVDSEVMLRQLGAANFKVSHDSSEPHDIVIINTCGFINDAKQESIDTILNVVAAKKNGTVKKVIVTGCLSARYYEELKKEIPEVDAYFGVNDLKKILKSLNVDYKKELLGERHLTTPSHYAYLKIAEGCDRKCSFCAIPLIRGKHVSKTIAQIVNEASLLADQGVKELVLIAQDLTYYGVDIYKKRKLATLLEKLSDVKNIEWIRLQYAYPAAFPMDVLKVMRERENICNYLDIPFQHISDRLLKSMNRAIDKKGTLKLIERIKKEIPGIALRTSLIVGYPGETEKDLKELMNFVSDVKFDRLGVFTYSHEESTKAFKLKDSVSSKVKQNRADVLMQLQQDISFEKNKALIGKTLKVIIDRKENEFLVARTEYDSPEVDNEVLIKAHGKTNLIGQFRHVKITSAEAYDLFGELLPVRHS
jgi:ribosomal protein S12 methylthiotransferase